MTAALSAIGDVWSYFSCVEMLVKLVLRVVPIALTVAMITTEMPAAIKPYSIAVAPDFVFQKRKNFRHVLPSGLLSRNCYQRTFTKTVHCASDLISIFIE